MPGIEDFLLSSNHEWEPSRRSPLFDIHCGSTSLEFLGRYHKFPVDPHEMTKDDDLLKVLPTQELQYAPADLSTEAFYKGLGKFGKKKLCSSSYDVECFNIAVEMMRIHFNRCRGTRRWTMDEVLSNMRRDTSPGPTLKTFYDSKGEAISDNRFWEWYSQFENDMYQVGGSISYWGASSKEELRLLEKVEAKKTRVFMSGSLFSYLFTSVYCADFNKKFYEGFIDTVSAVGMSKFNGGFHLLYDMMRNKDNAGSLDASGWDTSMFAELLFAIAQFRVDCMTYATPMDHVAMANIYSQVVESFICTPLGELCMKVQGNPSGSANTIVDNTLGHFIVKAYVFVRALRNNDNLFKRFITGVPTPKNYLDVMMDNVCMKLFGDDDLFTISNDFKQDYSIQAIKKISSELGFEFTSENECFKSLYDLSFLSHNVLSVKGGFYVPYLPLSRLCASAVYSISDDLEIRAQRLVNLRYEGYFTPGWLEIVDRLILKFQQLHPEYSHVFKYGMSNAEIEYLYLPLESDSDKRIPQVLNVRKDDRSTRPPWSRKIKNSQAPSEQKEEGGSSESAWPFSIFWASFHEIHARF